MMICKNCNTEIPDNLSVCPKCGASTGVEAQLVCQKCGAPINANDDYCRSCGAYTEKKSNEIEVKKQSVAGLAALGFVIPILGLIFAIMNAKSNKNGAIVILIASIIGFVIEASVFLPSISYYL